MCVYNDAGNVCVSNVYVWYGTAWNGMSGTVRYSTVWYGMYGLFVCLVGWLYVCRYARMYIVYQSVCLSACLSVWMYYNGEPI